MLISGIIPLRDRFTGRVLMPGNVLHTIALELMQMYYEERGLWSPDEEAQSIWIGYLNGSALLNPSPKPAIVAQRGAVKFGAKSGIGARAGRNLRNASQTYMDLIEGSVLIRCIEKNCAVADDYAQEVFQLFGMLRNLTKDLGYFSIDYNTLTIGEPVMLSGSVRPGEFAVPVSFACAAQISWQVTPEGRLLEGVKIGVNDES